MSKKLCLVLSLVLIMCGIAMAASKPMSDQQLSAVTAGSGFGASGVVALPGSDTDVTDKATLQLSGSALRDAKGLSIANSVGGALAVGVNVWDGSTAATDDLVFSVFGVRQVNVLNNAVPVAQGAVVGDYASAGSVLVRDPSYKASGTYLGVDVGYINKSSFKVSNTYDQFLGLAAAGDLDVDLFPPDADATGAICVVCNTYDRFRLSDKDYTKVWGDLDYATYDTSVSASLVKTRGPIFIDDATAQYIVGEDATLKAQDITSLTLSDDTLRNASSVYIVNSVKSLVGVGVNVASAPSGLSRQVNVVNNNGFGVVD